jgi:protein O-GlcNAc transferase
MNPSDSRPSNALQQQAFRLARALEKSGDWPAAERAYAHLLTQYPQHKAALLQRSNVLQHLGRQQEAIAGLQVLLALDPLLAAAHCNLGALLDMQGDRAGALQAYEQALALEPNLKQALGNAMGLLDRSGQHPQADQLLQAALQHRPDNTDLRWQWAVRLRMTHRHREAVAELRLVLRHNPENADALLELGGVLMLLGAYDAARRRYERLLKLQPQHRLALYSLTQALESLGREEDALLVSKAALDLDPTAAEALCQYEYMRLSLCDWDGYEQRTAAIEASLERHCAQGEGTTLSPLRLLSFPLPLALHRSLSERWSDGISHSARALRLPPTPARITETQAPIRVGYLSADFCEHPMGILVHGLFAHHNRARFEVFAYSLADRDDAFTASVRRGVDHFCNASAMDAQTLARRIRADRIDVLIDLMGHTRQNCAAVLAMRPAPLQLLYLGYPGSMGADFIDGVIADHWLIPPELEVGYREKVHRLPCGFVWSAAPAGCSPTSPVKTESHRLAARSARGLPAQAPVYACFNRAHKLDPHTFDLWLGILRQVPASVLWLIQASPMVRERLRSRAAAVGLNPERIVFSSKVDSVDFEDLCALADLHLDTTHYGSGATGVAALHAGLPLLTRPGETFVSRMGASLCAATGLHELICDSEQAYVDKAVELGRQPEALAQLRRRLLEQQADMPLFQTARWVGQLEGLLWHLCLAREQPGTVFQP